MGWFDLGGKGRGILHQIFNREGGGPALEEIMDLTGSKVLEK